MAHIQAWPGSKWRLLPEPFLQRLVFAQTPRASHHRIRLPMGFEYQWYDKAARTHLEFFTMSATSLSPHYEDLAQGIGIW